MGTITLWGRETSANVQKTLWTLAELGVPYTRIDVGGKFGGLDSPEYGAMNPNRLVPVLQDGDLTLWESHAIIRYLAATYGVGTLWPEAPVERALVDQWTDWTTSTFQPAWVGLFWTFVRTPASKRDPAIIADHLKATIKAFRVLDDRLAEVPFLAGENLTYADIAAGAALYRWTTMEIERPELPNVEAWHERLLERPAFVKGVCISYADLVARETA